MADCCNDKACALEAMRARQGHTLRVVLAINAVMFLVEFSAGLVARSTALLSDSLDNLGDALTYGLSLFAVSRDTRAKARVALFKGGLILVAAFFVLGQVAYAAMHPGVPVFETMAVIAVVALLANSVCLVLLWRHKSEDVNMSSVWECSRNDILSNLAVLAAAAAVWLTQSGWPDLVVGLLLSLFLLRSAMRVMRSAFQAAARSQDRASAA